MNANDEIHQVSSKSETKPTIVRAESRPRAPRILLCFTGSVASIKARDVLGCFVHETATSCDVRVVVTDVARRFLRVDDLRAALRDGYSAMRSATPEAYAERFPDGHPNRETFVYTDDSEWREWEKIGDPVTHVRLRKWADVLLVAPLSANTLAKMANGICDNLLTCVWRAWDFSDETKRVYVAPAMNTSMWTSPFTAKHIASICAFPNVRVIPPVEKTLACGDAGVGAMASPKTVRDAVQAGFANKRGGGKASLS